MVPADPPPPSADVHCLLCSALAQEAGFPRVQRDIAQVEQYSQKLRSRAARADATAESLEASRLLAAEGLNPRKLTQALHTFELRPTYEDVFQVEAASVEDYLQQVGRGVWNLGAWVRHVRAWVVRHVRRHASAARGASQWFHMQA